MLRLCMKVGHLLHLLLLLHDLQLLLIQGRILLIFGILLLVEWRVVHWLLYLRRVHCIWKRVLPTAHWRCKILTRCWHIGGLLHEG